MIDFTIEAHIERPAGTVFEYVSDPVRLSSWQTNTVSAVQEGDGPFGVGTRLREVHRVPGGKEVESLVEVSEYEPGRVFALRVIEGTPVHLTITLEPVNHGTTMRLRAHGRLSGPSRLTEPLIGRVLKRQFKRQSLTLKQLLEEERQS